ncbi:hypothetical protein SEA_NUCCI_52 [Microbacterium phage Nucci]|nr:hypothetical protein SEA_NUCCI_52 [Microbacterium phage Nucci]
MNDKAIWSATKKWFNSLSDEVQWGDLSEYERTEARRVYLEEELQEG